MIDTPHPKNLWQLAPENLSNPQRVGSSSIISIILQGQNFRDVLVYSILKPLKSNFYLWTYETMTISYEKRY